MAERRIGKLDFDPARNPAVLDTLTWDAPALVRSASAQTMGFWEKACAALQGGGPLPSTPSLTLHDRSIGRCGNRSFLLAECADGQHALVELTADRSRAFLPDPLLRIGLPGGAVVSFHEASAENVHFAYSKAAAGRLPQAMRMTPRLGIGTRMSRAVWLGIWQAVGECSFAANAIQNSQRELNLLENVRERVPAQRLYYPGIGFVPEGHTGSTFEGLWLCGVCEALKAGVTQPYGADADHIMVKRGWDGLDRARKVLTAARRYSFFTIDVSDILDYSELRPDATGTGHADAIERRIGDGKAARDVLASYKAPLRIGGRSIRISDVELAGLIGKYWRAMEAMDALVPFIASLKAGEPFDLELSIDEHPPEIRAFDCLTSEVEVAFILEEAKRRGLPLTHLAPNLGVEKHTDYRYRDGLAGLEARTRALHELAQARGVLIDCHSGDDFSAATRQALNRATGGMIHFKVSPHLQNLFADVLYEHDRQMFRAWWDDTYEFVKENAREGSALAADCLKQYESEPESGPNPKFDLFRLFCYATVGKRNAEGNFTHREKFYSLGQDFSAEYTRRVKGCLCTIAHDLLP